MNKFWENLDPKKKQWGMIILAVLGLGLVVSIFVGGAEEKYGKRPSQDIVTNVLNERSSRDIGIDAMASRLRSVETNLRNRSKELDDTRVKLEETRNSVGVGRDVARQLAALKEEVNRLREDKKGTEKAMKQLQTDIKDGNLDMPRLSGGQSAGDFSGGHASSEHYAPDDPESEPANQFRDAPVPRFGDQRVGQSAAEQRGAVADTPTISRKLSMTTVAEAQPVGEPEQAEAESEGVGIYIPSGSLLSGTLMTGLDAPTGQGARRDPFPVVVRLQKDAILPNDYSADVKGCMAILSGFGDLSSERVYLRTEGVSCVREDGQSIEARISGYAVGEDGKAGMRARLVTKQGSLIGRSLVAGFFGGIAQAFDVSPVPTLDTSGDAKSVQYLDTFSEGAVQGGVVGGASNALEKVADFWLKMADSMFPVLELDASRKMDIVMVKGAELKLQ